MAQSIIQFIRAPLVFTACAICVCLAGCREKPTTVKGLVTLDGKPLAIGEGMRGSVVFEPAASGGNTLTGVIDSSGRYQLSAGSNLSVAPSAYWVTVSATELVPATDERPSSAKLMTPSKYASATDSGFRIEVVAGENEVNLPLVSELEPATEPSSQAESATEVRTEEAKMGAAAAQDVDDTANSTTAAVENGTDSD